MVRQNGGRRGSKVAEDRLASRNETLPRPRSFEVAIHLPTNNEITNSPLPSDEIVKPAKNNTSRVTYLRIRNRGLNIPCPGLPGTNERKRLLLTGEIATARACVRARLFRRRRRREGRAIERYRKLELDRERETTPPRTYVYHVDRNTCEQRCGFHGEEEEKRVTGSSDSFLPHGHDAGFFCDLDPPKIGFSGNRSTMRRL